MNIIIIFTAGKPMDSRTECEAIRRMAYFKATIFEALSSFESYCTARFPQGSQIIITTIKL